MATEIERKFLVKAEAWRPKDPGVFYSQGYLSSQKERVVRVRVAGEKAFLTVKGLTSGVSRLEFEYEIPVPDARRMLNELCEKPIIEKTRHRESHDGRIWEIDVFHGENDGLLTAEIELRNVNETFARPPWLADEVSSDPRYFNSNLAEHPYKSWASPEGARG